MKISNYTKQLSSYTERIEYSSFFDIITNKYIKRRYTFYEFCINKQYREIANCVLKDMLHLICM